MIVPVYVAEASPPLIRGRLVGIYEIFVSAGTMLGFWINYGLAKNVPPSSKQWIISFAVQLIPGSLLLIGTFFIPESPRYLAQHKGRDKCIASLQRLRCIPSDHPYILEEVHSILQQIEHEEAIAEGHGIKTFLKELTKPGNQKRLLIGCLMFIFMQMAGSNAINYYSPAIFKSIGLTGSNTAFFATGIYGVVRFVAIIFAMVFVVDRFGRTRTLMAGSVVMVSKIVQIHVIICYIFYYNQHQKKKKTKNHAGICNVVHWRVCQNRFPRLWWVLWRQLRRLRWYRHDLHIRYRVVFLLGRYPLDLRLRNLPNTHPLPLRVCMYSSSLDSQLCHC